MALFFLSCFCERWRCDDWNIFCLALPLPRFEDLRNIISRQSINKSSIGRFSIRRINIGKQSNWQPWFFKFSVGRQSSRGPFLVTLVLAGGGLEIVCGFESFSCVSSAVAKSLIPSSWVDGDYIQRFEWAPPTKTQIATCVYSVENSAVLLSYMLQFLLGIECLPLHRNIVL